MFSSEPAVIDHRTSTVTGKPNEVQRIHRKVVKSEVALYRLLVERYGEKEFEIKMRHNVYHIRRPSGSATISPDEPEMRNILCKGASAA